MQCQHAALAEEKNRVEALEMMTLLIALLGAVSGVLAVVNQRRTAKEAHKVAHAAHVINGYDQLCKALRAELASKGEEIDKLRCRIIEIERRESEWNVEKTQLEDRILRLEEERNHLKGLLDELYSQTCGKEK